MRKCLMIAVLSVSLAGWAQWEKQGTVLGNITDTEVIQLNGTAALMYAATDGSGVFKSTDAVTWVPVNGTGTSILPDLHIKAIAAIPGWPNYLVAISDHGVYRTPDQGATWAFLQGPTPNLLPKDFPFEDIAVASYLGQLYYYLATYGGGVYCKIMGNDWLALSTGFETGDTYVISIGANEDRILAGTTLHLYWQTVASSQWVKYIDSMSFPSFAPVRAISYRHPEYAIVALGMMPVGGIYGGLFYTTDVNWGAKPNFYALNPSGDMPTNEEFISIDTSYLNPAYVGAAGTRDHLYRIPDPVTNTGTYTALAFRGPVKGLSLGRGGASSDFKQAFFGGPGKGPFRANLGNLTQRPTPIRSGMQDWQVSDIGASTQYSNSTDWEVFTASSVNGLFKNQEAFDAQTGAQGYFTRMIGATARDGVPEVNCLVLSPVYKQGGSIGDAELTLFAGTEGEGVLRSSDGGRSWFAPDTGSTKPLPTASRVKALLISPAFATDQTLWAAVISGSSNTTGVYVSTSGGLNWSLLTTSGPPLGNFNMTSLALHPDFPTAAALYLGCGASGTANTVWRYDGALWTAVGSMTHPVTSLSATKYLGNLRIFAGTEDDGVHYWSGSAWTAYNSALTSGRFISGLKASPNFAVDHTLIAAVRPADDSGSGGFCWIQYPGLTWTAANGGLPADLRLQSVAFAPNYSATNAIFCGSTHSGVYTTRMAPGAPPDYDWQGAAGFYTTPKKVNGLAVDPGDPNFVLAATDDSGVMVSLDGGFTFRPWSKGLTYAAGSPTYPVPSILSVVVTKPLSGTSRRAVCGTAGHGMYYLDYDPNASDRTNNFYYPQWHASDVPGPVPPTYGNINEIRYVWETVLLNETFEGTTFPPAGWSRSNGGGGGKGLSWVRANSTTPAATGCTPRPVGSPLTGWVALMDSYCDGSGATQNDWLITPALSMESVSSLTLEFDHRYEFWDIPSSEIAEVRVSRPSQGGGYYLVQSWTADRGPIHETIDLTGFMEEGMRVAFRYQGAYDEYWMIDNVKITMNKNEAMRASDTSNGDFFSDNYGATWSQSTGIPAGVGLTDISFRDGGYLPGGRGKSSFVWGCSSGKSLAFRASCTGNGKAWKYDPAALTWAACPTTTLNTCEDYRAILKLSNGTLFLGSKGIGGASSWTGLWRSEDDCATWTSAVIPNLGFPSNPQVYALQELDNGDILAGLDGASGGVYMSDAVSGGRAWVQVNSGFSSSEVGTVDLAGGGGLVYTGMSVDGIYASDTVIPYAEAPEAYFECAAEACVNSPVSFTDRSAGRVNVWSWSFGDSGSSSLQNPAHAYAATGTYHPQLTASNGYFSDAYSQTVQVRGELEVSIRLNKGKALSAGFEAGADGFTSTGLWHRSTTCGATTTVYYYGQEGTCNYSTGTAANSGTLTSPSISLANIGSTLSLSFRYLLQTEEVLNYDKATVEISTNGGGAWTILDRDDVNGGTLLTDNAWHTASINLSAYAGNTVLVRFAFNTVDAANNTFKGFMVDDIAVAASASEIYAAWNDIAGETGYQIYRSDSPSSRTADATLGACSASTCATTLPAGYTYYRIQVKSTSYACGDGPIGGSW